MIIAFLIKYEIQFYLLLNSTLFHKKKKLNKNIYIYRIHVIAVRILHIDEH